MGLRICDPLYFSVMASYPLCFTHANQTLFLQNKLPLSIPGPRCLFSTLSSPPPIRPPFLHKFIRNDMNSSIGMKLPVCLSKRMLNFSLLTVILSFPLLRLSVAMAEELELQRYTDSIEGFTLLIPSSWIKVEKAGATVLFEDANRGANNVGVVVSPVRLTNLGEFGTPQFVADKLIQVEKRKESTKEAEVIAFSERSGHGGLQVYEFEYKVDSTRGGMKRIFLAAFVASKKLYLLNIAHSDKPETPLDTHRRLMLEQVLHSFDTA